MGLTLYTWGDWNSSKYITEGYMANAGLYSIINRITKTAAIAPFKVYLIKDQKKHQLYKAWTGARATKESITRAMTIKNLAYEEDLTHPLNQLIEKPNSWNSASEFTQTAIGFILITGNRFLFVNRLEAGANKGKPVEVYNLPPQHMRIIIGGGLWQVSGYELQLGQIVPIPKENVIHARYWNPNYDTTGSHLWGLSPLTAGSKTIERSNLAELRGATQLKNAGAAGVLFDKTPGGSELSPEQASEMKQALNEEILGLDNSGTIKLANGDMGFINFGMTAVELAVIEQEKYSDEKMCNLYNVPAGLLMANANATDNNIKAWNKQLITGPVLQALNELRDDWNKIAEMYGEAIYVDYDLSVYPELQEDLEKTANVMQKAWWLKGNEKRLAMGYDEDTEEPMMQKYLVPNNMTELGNLNPDLIGDELDDVDTGNGEEDIS